jgi:DNA-binding MarR family transcriptional regulator
MTEMIGSLLADLSRLMRRAFDARAREIGVTRVQWQVLSVLSRHEGVNQGGLAELLDVEAITLCRMVDRLQEADLVERRANPTDRRAWRLYLTDRARTLLDELRPLAMALTDEAMTGLSEAEQQQLHQLLERIRSNLTRRAVPELVRHG